MFCIWDPVVGSALWFTLSLLPYGAARWGTSMSRATADPAPQVMVCSTVHCGIFCAGCAVVCVMLPPYRTLFIDVFKSFMSYKYLFKSFKCIFEGILYLFIDVTRKNLIIWSFSSLHKFLCCERFLLLHGSIFINF